MEPGITLATVLAIELAIFATTPFFLELRFFAPVLFFDLVFDFGLVIAAFFAITQSGTRSPNQIILKLNCITPGTRSASLGPILYSNLFNSDLDAATRWSGLSRRKGCNQTRFIWLG